MVSALISRVVILLFGTLYPAYKSYKAVNRRNAKEYVKWMMYWIVFALFTFVETFADLFVAWLPFYYEIKIIFVLWLLSPATKGASILYKKFVHPMLSKKEKDIDTHLDKVTEQGYTAFLSLGSKGLNYATNVVVTTAIKGQAKLAENLKRSYSMSDVSDEQGQPRRREVEEEEDDDTDNRLIEESYRQEMNEKDIDTTQQTPTTRRRAKTKKEDLGNISEEEEVKTKKKTYNTKETRSTPDGESTTSASSEDKMSSVSQPQHKPSRFLKKLDLDSLLDSRSSESKSNTGYKRSYSSSPSLMSFGSSTRSAPSTPITSSYYTPFTSFSRYSRSNSFGSSSGVGGSSSSYTTPSSSWRSRSSYTSYK